MLCKFNIFYLSHLEFQEPPNNQNDPEKDTAGHILIQGKSLGKQLHLKSTLQSKPINNQ